MHEFLCFIDLSIDTRAFVELRNDTIRSTADFLQLEILQKNLRTRCINAQGYVCLVHTYTQNVDTCLSSNVPVIQTDLKVI